MSDRALELAAAVRSGSRSAREVVDEHLAVVAARDGELHACNLVTDDAAAPPPTRSTPRWPGATIPDRSPACPSC